VKQNLTRKQVIIRFFLVTGMTEQNRYNWPDFFRQKMFFEVLGKDVARRPGSQDPFQSKFCFRFLGYILAELCLYSAVFVDEGATFFLPS